MRNKIFFDTEFTGLHKNTSLLSMGLVSESEEKLYCELTDYDKSQITPWLKENVIPYAKMDMDKVSNKVAGGVFTHVRGDKKYVAEAVKKWLEPFGEVEMWSDCLHYDWVLFVDLFGDAFDVPENVYYIPFDLSTMFLLAGVDPDISRSEFANMPFMKDHHALDDAILIKNCYDKLDVLFTPTRFDTCSRPSEDDTGQAASARG